MAPRLPHPCSHTPLEAESSWPLPWELSQSSQEELLHHWALKG